MKSFPSTIFLAGALLSTIVAAFPTEYLEKRTNLTCPPHSVINAQGNACTCLGTYSHWSGHDCECNDVYKVMDGAGNCNGCRTGFLVTQASNGYCVRECGPGTVQSGSYMCECTDPHGTTDSSGSQVKCVCNAGYVWNYNHNVCSPATCTAKFASIDPNFGKTCTCSGTASHYSGSACVCNDVRAVMDGNGNCACKPGYSVQSNSNGVCVINCPTGQMWDTTHDNFDACISIPATTTSSSPFAKLTVKFSQ